MKKLSGAAVGAMMSVFALPAVAQNYPAPKEATFIAKDFKFNTGEVMADVRLNYRTIGEPSGQPVLILHGTSGSGAATRVRWHMTVLVVETRGGADTAAAVSELLRGVVGVARCADDDLDALFNRPTLQQMDLVVVACNGDPDAGHRICRAVRAVTSTMLAMLTSSTREADELLAFAHGCDD